MTGFKNYILALAVVPALASCASTIGFKAMTAGIAASSYGVFSRPDVNLKEKNYVAADFMAVKIKDIVGFDDTILALPLEESDHAGISSQLGANIPLGVGMRLVELGYQVQLHKVAAADGNASLYPDPKAGDNADFILKGSYRYGKKHMDIFLRLVDVRAAKVVSSFDYSMLLSKEVRELSETGTKIFRISPK